MNRKNSRPADATRAVAYIRVSTERQDLGPEAQLAALTAWSKLRGVTIAGVHRDIGVSGGAPVDDCPALLDALRDLEGQNAGVLLVAKRDRLARDVVKAAIVESLAAKVGARVAAADGVGDGDDPAAALLRTMVDAFAQYERAMIRSRTKAALAAKRDRLERVGAVRYGYSLLDDGRKLVPNIEEQAVIAKARALRAQGLVFRQIAVQLSAAGLHPRQGAGKRWDPKTVARLCG